MGNRSEQHLVAEIISGKNFHALMGQISNLKSQPPKMEFLRLGEYTVLTITNVKKNYRQNRKVSDIIFQYRHRSHKAGIQKTFGVFKKYVRLKQSRKDKNQP